jgi:hypothetical protein
MVRYHCGTVGMLHETSRAFNPGLLVMFLIQLKIHDIYSFPSPNGWFSLWNYIYIISRVQFRICLVSYQLIHWNQLTWTINSQPRYCQYPLPFQKKSGGNSQISRIYNGFMVDLRSQIDRPRRLRPFVRSSGAWASSSAGRWSTTRTSSSWTSCRCQPCAGVQGSRAWVLGAETIGDSYGKKYGIRNIVPQ